MVQPPLPSLLGGVDCIPPSLSAYAPDGFSVLTSERSDINGMVATDDPVPPPAPPAADIAAVLGVTLQQFADASVDGIENILRRAEHLVETQEVLEAYIAQERTTLRPHLSQRRSVGQVRRPTYAS